MSLFTGKTLMITGGTGSFGNAVLIRRTACIIWMRASQISEKSVFFRETRKSRMICVMNIR